MKATRTRASATRTLVAVVVALVCASLAYRIAYGEGLQHGALVFVGIPALLAIALAAIHPKSSVGTVNKTIAIALCLSGVLFGEAFVCIVLASPVFFLAGTVMGKILENARRMTDGEAGAAPPSSRWKHGIILLAPFYLEGVVPGYVVPREEVVTVTRVIPATATAVRASLASPMTFDQPLPRFFRLGFPTPGRTSGAGLAVGDRRTVEFQHGGHHPGTLTLEVTHSDPAAVRFAAVADDSYITHWLAWRSAEVRWEQVTSGATRVTWTLRYARRLDPAFYFKPLERYGVWLAAGYLTETLATPRAPGR